MRSPSDTMAGMMVCMGRLPGATALGCPGSREKLWARLWNRTPDFGAIRSDAVPFGHHGGNDGVHGPLAGGDRVGMSRFQGEALGPIVEQDAGLRRHPI